MLNSEQYAAKMPTEIFMNFQKKFKKMFSVTLFAK